MEPLSASRKLVVVDLGVGLPAALVSSHFVRLGAKVLRLEPAGGDPFYEIYPAYATWREGTAPLKAADLDETLSRADVCICGGEDYPDLAWKFDAAAMSRRNERLVVLDMTGGVDANGNRQKAVDLLAQARSGLCFEQFSERPIAWALRVPSFAAGLQGITAIWAGLIARERMGLGQVVTTSMQHGAAMICMPDRIAFERDDAKSIARIPLDVRALIFQCKDGHYIQFAMQRAGALARVHEVLGIEGEVDPFDPGAKRPGADPRDFFGDYETFRDHICNFNRPELLKAFQDNGIPADLVLEPGVCWEDAQTKHNRRIQTASDGTRFVGQPITTRPVSPAPTRKKNEIAPNAPPLSGIRVVGMGTFIAGPYASKALADLGADVIKVDSPSGDPNANVYSAWCMSNSGKRSIVVDVKTDEGKQVLQKLCAGADVFSHNFRPGVVERLGLDPDSLRKTTPDIITLQSSTYGMTGPKASYAGLDPILQAVSGLEVLAGGKGNAPMWYRMPVVDYTTGTLGGIALLMALYERLSSGGVVEMEVSLFDSSLFLTSELIQTADGVFNGAVPVDGEQLGYHPAERIYETSDGWVAVTARSPEMAQRFAEALGLSFGPRNTWADAQTQQIAERFKRHTTAAILQLLGKADVWADRCLKVRDGRIEQDPAALAAGLAVSFDDPHYGRITTTGALFGMSRSKVVGPQRSPHFGENTRQVLEAFGYSDAEIDDYFRRKVVA